MPVVVYSFLMVLCVAIAGILSLNKHKPQLLSIIILSLIVSFFSLYLSINGIDTHDRFIYGQHFLIYYSQFINNPVSILSESFQQIGWAVYNTAIRLFTDDVAWLLFITSFLYSSTIFYVFSKIEEVSFFWLVVVFCVSIAPLYSVSLSRQMLGAAIGNIVFFQLYNKKYIKGFVLSAIGVLVHSASIIVPVAFVLHGFARTKKRMITALLVGIVILVFIDPLMNAVARLLPYLYETMRASFEAGSQGYGIVLKGLPCFIMTICGIAFRDQLNELDQQSGYYWICTLISALSWAASAHVYWFWRISLFLMAPFCVYVVRLLQIRENKMAGLAGYAIVAIMVLLAFRETVVLFSV